MKAWQVNKWCEPEEMTLAEVPPPEPGPGQVRIRNRAAGLNFFDILQIQGKYQVKPVFPFTPGAEVAGIVDAVGPDVDDFAPGERVMALSEGGGFAELTIAPVAKTFRVPEQMGFPEAASLLVYHTSYFALNTRARLQRGEWLLVHAGASGVGMAAIQIGRSLGAWVIATAGSQQKLEFCAAHGADHTLSYADPSWVDRVKELTGGRGADAIYDPVGGDVFDLSSKCIAPEGRLLVVGFASGRIPGIQANRILLKDISVVGVFWGSYASRNPAYLAETHEALAEMFLSGEIRPVVSKTFPLDQAPAALGELAGRKITGKAALVID